MILTVSRFSSCSRVESLEKVSPVEKRYEPLPQISPSTQYGPPAPIIPPNTLPKLSPSDGKLCITLNIIIFLFEMI